MVNGASTIAETAQQHVEHRRVNDLQELDSRDIPTDPADVTFQRFQAVQLHPDLLVELRPLDELQSAAVAGQVVHADPIMALRRPSQVDLRPQRHASAAPQVTLDLTRRA